MIVYDLYRIDIRNNVSRYLEEEKTQFPRQCHVSFWSVHISGLYLPVCIKLTQMLSLFQAVRHGYNCCVCAGSATGHNYCRSVDHVYHQQQETRQSCTNTSPKARP